MRDKIKFVFQTRRMVSLRSQPKMLSIIGVMIACLLVVSVSACQFHPVSSEQGHEDERPIGHHQDGQSDGISCLSAMLSEHLILVEFTFVSWVAKPIQLHITPFVSLPFIPPRYIA